MQCSSPYDIALHISRFWKSIGSVSLSTHESQLFMSNTITASSGVLDIVLLSKQDVCRQAMFSC